METALLLADRARGAYYGLLIADALSMPVHWYYNPNDITKSFGRITTFQAPKESHPSSIMSLSNTGGAGRGSQQGSIIGDVINHGQKQWWGKANVHYHRGMAAGDNTLNALVTRMSVRTLTGLPTLTPAKGESMPTPPPFPTTPAASFVAGGAFSTAPFLKAYVSFMTTPGSHSDCYAETYHRMFFANMQKGKAPEKCADDDGHNVDSAGGLVLLPPPTILAAVAAAGAGKPTPATPAKEAAIAQMYATHNSERLATFVGVYATALAEVLVSPPSTPPAAALVAAVGKAGKSLGVDLATLAAKTPGFEGDLAVIQGKFGSACYIEGSLPSLLYLAGKHAGAPAEALIANTNVGGENCHRGAALGALLGAAHGMAAWPKEWVEGLRAKADIAAEADAFAEAVKQVYLASLPPPSRAGL